MDSASDGASDAGSVMVAGDGSNDDETRVKDTSKKKRPKWSGKKQHHPTWLWRYLGYADATGNGPTIAAQASRA